MEQNLTKPAPAPEAAIEYELYDTNTGQVITTHLLTPSAAEDLNTILIGRSESPRWIAARHRPPPTCHCGAEIQEECVCDLQNPEI